jgi:large subunit ribosomal protein L13
MKTFLPKEDELVREWFVMDASGIPLGRLAVRVANLLRGKDKVTFTPAIDVGDFVVVLNAEKVKLGGRKETQKIYQRYSGFRDGLRKVDAATMREKHPDRIIKLAVQRMLPKNNLSRGVFRRLKVYRGEAHPHAAQKPSAVKSL